MSTYEDPNFVPSGVPLGTENMNDHLGAIESFSAPDDACFATGDVRIHGSEVTTRWKSQPDTGGGSGGSGGSGSGGGVDGGTP